MARVVPPVAVAIAAALAACSDPPAGPADAAATDARAPIDAPSSGDAAPTDNPFGIRFTDVTDLLPARYYGGRSAADPWGVGSGVALGDVDGDGDLDVVLARADIPESGRPGGPPVLLRNETADFGFAEDEAFSAMLAGRVAHGAALGDYDADGDLDLFLACAGADLLLENDGAGSFSDVTSAAGVAGPDGDVTVGAVWADLDRDGLLDLYVVAHTAILPPIPDPLQANRLYLGDGAGGFVDVSVASGTAGDGSSQAALISDLDGDGDLEIYVANDQYTVDGEPEPTAGLDADALYDLASIDGEGVPAFVDRGETSGVTGPRSSMGVALADLDRDGHDDLYVSDWGTNHLQLWRPGDARYDTDTAGWGLGVRATADGYMLVSWGVRFTDVDRDGWEEVYVVNGHIEEPGGCDTLQQLDRFLRRPPDEARFVDVTGAVGFPDPPACQPAPDTPFAGRGVVTGDLDGDGDDDMIVSGFVEPYRFYRNDTPQAGRHRLRVRPIGTVSGPDPIGAVLSVELTDGRVLRRTLYAGGDTYSQSARVLEVGTGGAPAIAAARIAWPSGIAQTLDVPLDETVAVVEPAWLSLSARSAAAADPAPVMTYAPVDAAGEPLGAAGAGRAVVVTRSDGAPVTVTDHGDGTYTAPLPHPGTSRRTVLALEVDGEPQRPGLTVTYR